MSKYCILDTNVLLSDPDCIYKFGDSNIVIPMIVIEELDSKKSLQDELGKNARKVSRYLDDLRKEGNLLNGVDIYPGTLKIATLDQNIVDKLPFEYKALTKPDNIIIAIAYDFHLRKKIDDECVLVSRDINVRIKADALGITSEGYDPQKVIDSEDSLYKGFKTIEANNDFINSFYSNRKVNLTDEEIYMNDLHANEFVIYKQKDGSGSAIGRFYKESNCIKEIVQHKDVFGLRAKNVEQQFALDLLFDDNVKLITLVGPAGTGKTLLAIAAGIKQVVEEGFYEKLIITKPVQPVGKDIGFLPGTKEEKMEPWIAPIKDNLDFLCGNKQNQKTQKQKKPKDPNQPAKNWNYSDRWFEEGLIEVEAITFLRGRSIPNAFIVIDEAQNLSLHELKTIITRVGEGTKIILTGDIDQIDNLHVDAYSNGLTCAVEKFKGYPIAGHISMVKGERSELATLASQIL